MRLFLVLSGGLSEHGEISEETRERVNVAISRRRDGDKLLFSGKYSLYDHAEHDTTEAAEMRAHAIAHGVPEDDILIEDASQDTIENLRNSSTMIHEAAPSELIIVTSWYHLARVAWLAERLLPDVPRSLVSVTTRDQPVEAILRETLALALADEILKHGMSLRDAHAAKEGIVPYVTAARSRIESSITDLEKQFDDLGGGSS